MVIFRVVLPVGSSWAREPCHWATRMCRHHMGTRVPVLGALGGSQGCRDPMSLCSRLWDSPQGCRDPVFLCSGLWDGPQGGVGPRVPVLRALGWSLGAQEPSVSVLGAPGGSSGGSGSPCLCARGSGTVLGALTMSGRRHSGLSLSGPTISGRLNHATQQTLEIFSYLLIGRFSA